MKYLIEEATLTGIADAVREKKGTTDLIQVSNLATEISNIQGGGTVEELTITSNGTYNPPTGIDGYAPVVVNVPQDGAPTAEELTFSGNMRYAFAQGVWDWFVRKYGNQIKTQNIKSADSFFEDSMLEEIPFEIKGNPNVSQSLASMFSRCNKLKTIPEISGFKIREIYYMFVGCEQIKEIPRSFIDNNDWSEITGATSNNTGVGGASQVFVGCYSLRRILPELFDIYNKYSSYSNSYLYANFISCCSLDELINLPCYEGTTGWTSNGFVQTFNQCFRLKNILFQMNEDGTPKIVKWKNQTINLTFYVGYPPSASYIKYITGYNSGITADKRVKDDATYQALKDDPDWFSTDINYSRYNHDSAVRTINSLPDTSAYLATAGGTNTIKFEGQSGAKTDGGAINTLTEEEIAVATAKGWTVSLV